MPVSCGRRTSNFIKAFDATGQPIASAFTFRNENVYKSFLGGMVSILFKFFATGYLLYTLLLTLKGDNLNKTDFALTLPDNIYTFGEGDAIQEYMYYDSAYCPTDTIRFEMSNLRKFSDPLRKFDPSLVVYFNDVLPQDFCKNMYDEE